MFNISAGRTEMMTVFADTVNLSQANSYVDIAKNSNQNNLYSCFEDKLTSELSYSKRDIPKSNQIQEDTQSVLYPFIVPNNVSPQNLLKPKVNSNITEVSYGTQNEAITSSNNLLNLENLISNLGIQNDKMAAIISQKNNTQQILTPKNKLNLSIAIDNNVIKNVNSANSKSKSSDSKNSTLIRISDRAKLKELISTKIKITKENDNEAVLKKILSKEKPSIKPENNTTVKVNSKQLDERIKQITLKNDNSVLKEPDKQLNYQESIKSIDKEAISANSIIEPSSNKLESKIKVSDNIIMRKDINYLINSTYLFDKGYNKGNLSTDKPVVNVNKVNNDNSTKMAKPSTKLKSEANTDTNINKDKKIGKHSSNYNKTNDTDFSSKVNLATINSKDSILHSKDGKQFLLSGTKSEEIIPRMLNIIKNLNDNSTSQAKLLLKPATLGTVIVDISLKDNIIKLKFSADSQEVVKSIENQIGQLKEKLTHQGLKISTVEVSINQKEYENQTNSNKNNNQQWSNSDKDLRQSFLDSFKYIEQVNENIITEEEFI